MTRPLGELFDLPLAPPQIDRECHLPGQRAIAPATATFKVSRTFADLTGADGITAEHVGKAVQLRFGVRVQARSRTAWTSLLIPASASVIRFASM